MQFFFLFIIKKKTAPRPGYALIVCVSRGSRRCCSSRGIFDVRKPPKTVENGIQDINGKKEVEPFFSPIGDGGLIAPFKLGLSNGKKKK